MLIECPNFLGISKKISILHITNIYIYIHIELCACMCVSVNWEVHVLQYDKTVGSAL